ncbi:DUF4435 domain-containing protein [Conchiformibius steedae]|uniref:DUF4435 domain-containing protein n=1 Tax=Conchiformibius steedae TaxID=153493 RepID=A0A3P2A2Q0_9NEIS|nr:DUF4435 domain-containing protein [Conchiformibius steedae]RRD89136.1 DUF4435 domain-containing protein [Conchiformibius steedae]
MAMMGRDDYAKTYSSMKSRKSKNKGLIYIEDITDKPFWERIATEHTVSLYSEQGEKIITGKSKLLKVCSANQLIAIDSDFDYLCPQHREAGSICVDKKDFILQTYAHGIENILLSPNFLHEVLDNHFSLYLNNHNNPILNIFGKLSEIWYPVYPKILYLVNLEGEGSFDKHHTKWIKGITINENQEINCECDDCIVEAYRDKINILDKELSQLIENQEQYSAFCQDLQSKGFSKENIYAFIRCHDFENQFVIKIMKKIIKIRQNKEKKYVEEQFSNTEVSNRKKQIANYFEEKNYINTILHHYFFNTYFETAKQNDFFIKKIIDKYQYIIQTS